MAIENQVSEEKTFKFEQRNLSLTVALIAITAALYTALGYIFQPISFLGIQFRVAELIVGMCILFPFEGLIGKIMGVFFVNLSSPLGIIDLNSCWVNVPALLCIIYFKDRRILKFLGGFFYAIIISFYVAVILYIVLSLPIWLMFIQVLVAEVILATLGIILFEGIKKGLNIEV
ncbi:MAG: QueT transporter family protein [Promethearchaeota archaeon]